MQITPTTATIAPQDRFTFSATVSGPTNDHGVTWSVNGASVSLTAGYLIAALAVPLLAAWAATGLALLVHLLYPRLAQAGSYGINTGGGGIGSLPAMLPGLGVLLTFTLWGTHVGAVELLAITGGAAAVVAVAGVAIVARRFRLDYIL